MPYYPMKTNRKLARSWDIKDGSKLQSLKYKHKDRPPTPLLLLTILPPLLPLLLLLLLATL